MTTLSLTEARAALPHLLDLVEQGEEVTITRHGKAVAVLSSPRKGSSPARAELDAGVARLRELLATAEPSGMAWPEGRADELVRQIRADRDAGR